MFNNILKRNYAKTLKNGLAGRVVAILGQQWGD